MRLVHIVEGGERAQMSKRSGDFVSLDELLDDIGVDATRWFMLWRSHDTTVDLDLELARRESSDNPVYYVQYAHARIASILRKAGAEERRRRGGRRRRRPGTPLEPTEKALVKRLLEFPDEVREAAARRAPHRICAYSTAVAADFHAFYRDCQVVGAEGEGVEALAAGALPADEADDRRRPRPARHLRPGADVKRAAPSCRCRDRRATGAGGDACAAQRPRGVRRPCSARLGARRRCSSPAPATGALGALDRAGQRRRRAPAPARRCSSATSPAPALADALGLADEPGPARVPARGGRGAGRSCSRWSSPARPRPAPPSRWSASSPATAGRRRPSAARLRRASATRWPNCAAPTSSSSSTARRSATRAAPCAAAAARPTRCSPASARRWPRAAPGRQLRKALRRLPGDGAGVVVYG